MSFNQGHQTRSAYPDTSVSDSFNHTLDRLRIDVAHNNLPGAFARDDTRYSSGYRERQVLGQLRGPQPGQGHWYTSTPRPYAASVAPSTRTATETIGETKPLTSFFVRPGFGERGQPISIRSNFFAVRTLGGMDKRAAIIYHYDVDINPVIKAQGQKKPKGLLRAVWEQTIMEAKGDFIPSFQCSVFDGRRNALTPIPFPIPEGHTQTIITAISPEGVAKRPSTNTESSDDENRRFKVIIKQVATINLEAIMEYCRAAQVGLKGSHHGLQEERFLTALMATNVLLRDLPSKRYAQVGATGNKFFTMDGSHKIAQGGVVCRGFTQSMRHSSSGYPLLNIDVAFSAFLASGPALEIVAKILDKDRRQPIARGGDYAGGVQRRDPVDPEMYDMNPRDMRIIKHKLRGAKFTVTHRHSTRLQTILSITDKSAEDVFFQLQSKDGSPPHNVSVVQYFKEYYQVEVTRPRLPCVMYGKRSFIPLEFVHLTEWNSLPPPKLTAEQTADMIKHAAVRPGDRAKMVLEWRKELDYDNQPKIRAWGLQVNSQMLKLTGRILPPPQVLYGGGQTAQLQNGSWNLRHNQFFASGKTPLRAWSVISFDNHMVRDDLLRYVAYLVDAMRHHGVHVDNAEPHLIVKQDPREYESIVSGLQNAARGAYLGGQRYVRPGEKPTDPQLICVVLPGRDAHLYETIKRIAFTRLKQPAPTQCMQCMKIRMPRGIEAYTGNLVMKIQSKLGGITHQVPIEDLPGMVRGKTMLLGADLGHPPIRPGYDSAPTVACSIATYNADCSLYSAQIRLQEGRDERVRDFSAMIEEHLKLFYKTNGDLPERILIFRDGVSEGQYAAVTTYEHEAVLTAAQRLDPNYRPKVLLCICVKKHNIRFFSNGTHEDSSGNLPNGLVVDRSVTHPYTYDFFLQAHQGRVGTARPTHYICLIDELALTPDQLQQLVHALCYGFARCTKSVSVVPVCYIADLVCQKARYIMHDPFREESTAPSVSSAGGTNKSKGYTPNPNLDVMQMQKILAKNPDLSDVMWWM